MKFLNKCILAAVLMFAMMIPAMAQFEDMFTEENFSKQPPITEKDVQAFIKSEKAYARLVEINEAGKFNAENRASIEKELGISVERYMFVSTKLAVCYTFMFESGVSEADLDTLFQELPEYLRPSTSEKALLKKYKTQIESTFNKIAE